MILYHFTTLQNLLLVSWNGLKPAASGKADWQWLVGRPCVWLTREESNAATADDIEHYGKLGQRYKLGEPRYGGPERVTVHLERHDRKLVPYRDIATAEVLSLMRPNARTSWWVYFGDIPPSKIEPITCAQAVAGLDIQIGIHDDPAMRASYARMRSELLQAGDPEQLVNWQLR